MALKKNHVLVIIAILGLVALTLIGACLAGGNWGLAFLRISISDHSAIYVELDGGKLRAATSAEGLASATPVPMTAANFQSPTPSQVTLPIPPDQLPEGITAVKASFERFGGGVASLFGICRTDAQKAAWQCDVQVWSQAGRTAAQAVSVRLPNPQKLTLVVRTAPSSRRLGVGVELTAGANGVSGVYKDGKPMPVQVSVTDAQGKEVAAKKGSLADFGFS